jgi:short-subunit dehydrogenase
MAKRDQGLAVVTGASTGIGFELARVCAQEGFELIVVADEAAIETAAQSIRSASHVTVTPVQADLSTEQGVEHVLAVIGDRRVDALLANAGLGLGDAFLDQPWNGIRHVIDTNVTGTLYLIHRVGHAMRAQGSGRILITGSIAGFMPGTYQAVYNASKAFLDSFSFALRAELQESGVTVTCLMPGATETDFFERAGMEDTRIGESSKDDPAMVARTGFDAMMAGDGDVVTGWMNKLRAAIANVTPAAVLARMHASQARPHSARK